MSFSWNPQFPSELTMPEPPPVWLYALLYLVIECVALSIVLPGLPKYGSLPWDRLLHYAGAVPFFCWLALSFMVYWFAFDIEANLAAAHNAERWEEISKWMWQSRSGLAVLDSVIFTPEPDLAERMLSLEGAPPENPGKVMALGSIEAADDGSRLDRLLDALLTPLAPKLAQAAKGGSFEIVMQCEHEALSNSVLAAWARLDLPGKPVARWLDNRRTPGFADMWFESERRPYGYMLDTTPKYRLLLTWHLNSGGMNIEHTVSEAAVALLLGSPALIYENPEIKRQGWLLRQITGEADQADRLLASLLKAEQVPSERIRHFWHSRLKGLAQHATLGAVRESGLKMEAHALDTAIGPQAPVTRWVIQALAAKMAHFGQGPQLIALPHDQGVALNVVAKEPAPVHVPWKEEYDYGWVLGPESGMCMSIWMFAMLLPPPDDNGSAKTIITCTVVLCMLVLFFLRHPGLFGRMVKSTVDYVMSWIGF
jgi:hypothetical protein